MSLAGVDPSASTGIAGNATDVRQVEPAIERVETKQSKQEDLAHTNMKLGLDVIFKQFLYLATYRWSTTDAPGKVLAIFPIHPSACNEYNDHIYQIMNNWVGGMKLRLRIIGTAFYGGGLYFIRVPPTFSIEEIHSMNLTGFTSFPHVDMDPKNLSSIDLDLQDYRANHFHTGDLNLSDPNSFGGYLVVVVNARLVTQSSEINSIDFRVESAGNFTFQVPRPIKRAATEASGPLTPRSLYVGNLRGCDDATTVNSGTSRLAIIKKSFSKPLNGHIFMRKAGGSYTYDRENSTLAAGSPARREEWWRVIDSARAANNEGMVKMSAGYEWKKYDDNPKLVFSSGKMIPLVWDEPGQQPHWKGVNFVTGASHTSGWGSGTGADKIYGIVKAADFFIEGGMDITLDTDATENGVLLFDSTYWHDDKGASLDNLFPFLVPNKADTRTGNKSMVSINTNYSNTSSAQPLEWAEDLAKFSQWPSGTAAQYKVMDKGGNIIAYMHLHEDGHMFAPPSETTVDLSHETTLVFDQWVSADAPVPIAAATANLYMTAAFNKAQRSILSKMSRYNIQ